jgi:Uma2 family endonuclease
MSLVTGSDRSRPGVKLTYDDFVLFPDDGKRHELIDGEHYVTPSPNLKHQAISANLLGPIWAYLRQNPIGKVYGAPLDVVFSHFDVVEPDLLYVSNARRTVLTAKNVQGAPDLVVEIGSPSTRRRDEKLKHQLYERFDVTEYWVVDPDVDVVRVYRRVEGKYQRAHELSLDHADVLTTPLLPGLELTLSEIFAD